jgi:hypothetical protein
MFLRICPRIRIISQAIAQTMLIDPGVMVAALIKREEHHDWAQSNFESLSSPCLTCETVLAECIGPS